MRHWYYGGPDQIRTDFGHLLTGYERSVHPFPDSIMQLSNTGGGGRGSDEGDVVGGVILHDKKPYWRRGGQFHYHQTLDAGENTLEAVLAREMIRSLTSTGGRFSAEDFRRRYIDLMTTPGTHNDTYASTCHRMFFKKWRSGVAPEKCPDNDGHNVDTMDGLVLPSVVALAALVRGESLEDAAKQGSEALAVTRASRVAQLEFSQVYNQALVETQDLLASSSLISQGPTSVCPDHDTVSQQGRLPSQCFMVQDGASSSLNFHFIDL